MNQYEELKIINDEINAAELLVASFEVGHYFSLVHIKRAIDRLVALSSTAQTFTNCLEENTNLDNNSISELDLVWKTITAYSHSSYNYIADESLPSPSQVVHLIRITREIIYDRLVHSDYRMPFWNRIFHSPKLLLFCYLPLVFYLLGYIYFNSLSPFEWFKNPHEYFTIEYTRQDFGKINQNRAVSSGPLLIANQYFPFGFGTHANSIIKLKFLKNASILAGGCGVDDMTKGGGSIKCKIVSNGKTLYESPIMRGKMKAEMFEVDVKGLVGVDLITEDAGDGNSSDHTNWVNLMLR
jgi:hypothetical protein